VNAGLKEFPYLLEICINEQNWIAKVQTDNLKQDVLHSKNRKILLMSKKQSGKRDCSARLAEMGYMTINASTIDEAAEILAREKTGVMIINAGSFLKNGPEYVKRINMEFPGTNIIVCNKSDSGFENQYRAGKIFYYGVNPVATGEMADVLYCAFQDQEKKATSPNAQSGFLPNTISKIHITNKYGRRVSLLAYDDMLQNNQGAGLNLISQLHDQAFPLVITHARSRKNLSDAVEQAIIEKELEYSDRLILFRSGEINKIPGSITRETGEFTNIRRSGNRIITITVQPAGNTREQDALNTLTAEAMADFLMEEMTAR
jgi:hypothetical protein